MRKFKVLVFILILIPFLGIGQRLSYNFSASYNYTYIKNIRQDSYVTNTETIYLLEKYSSNSGCKITANLNLHFNDYIFITSGMYFDLIRFNKFTEIYNEYLSNAQQIKLPLASISNSYLVSNYSENLVNDNYSEDIEKLGNQSIIYTTIPLNIGISALQGKLNVKFGVLVSFTTYAITYSQALVKSYSTKEFTNPLWSGNVEIEYPVYKNIGINFNYNRSFNSIYNKDTSIGEPKYNIFSIGFTYSIVK